MVNNAKGFVFHYYKLLSTLGCQALTNTHIIISVEAPEYTGGGYWSHKKKEVNFSLCVCQNVELFICLHTLQQLNCVGFSKSDQCL